MKRTFDDLINAVTALGLKAKVQKLKKKLLKEQKSKSYYKLALKKSKQREGDLKLSLAWSTHLVNVLAFILLAVGTITAIKTFL